MSQEVQAAEQQQTGEAVLSEIEQIDWLRDSIYTTAVEHKLTFDVVFNALAQVTSNFIFDYLLVTQSKLTDENVAAIVTTFGAQVEATAKIGLEALRELAQSQAVQDVEPKET